MLSHGKMDIVFDDTFDLKALLQKDYNGNVLRYLSGVLKEAEYSLRKRINAGVTESEYAQLNVLLHGYVIAYENLQMFWKFCTSEKMAQE